MTIGIRGLGLIGGSFEKAFARAGHNVLDLKDAPAAAVRSCSVVIVCLPPRLVVPWILQHAGDFAENAIVTDAAGVKQAICDGLSAVAGKSKWSFVGGHPMAGKECSGYANATADLFVRASMIFTPYESTPASVVERLRNLFAEIGFTRFVTTTPSRHDEMIAYTSQLAHVVSSAYVRDALSREHAGFSAGSFQDMTRVASVDPDMWTDLFLYNANALDAVLTSLMARLREYRDSIRAGDAAALRTLLAEGRKMKMEVK